ncbi:MAG: hypothetical protein RMJ98_06915 [Myxococcales bacterium]|nr:hypothetical protein [Myxococcales bacterium]
MHHLALALWLLLTTGCESTEEPPPCTSRPAFRLQISAEKGDRLPKDLKVTIHYGGNGEETFELSSPSPSPQVLFCALSSEETMLSCELWTDGAANLKITGTGLKPYDKRLAATTDACGITTTLLEVKLSSQSTSAGDFL